MLAQPHLHRVLARQLNPLQRAARPRLILRFRQWTRRTFSCKTQTISLPQPSGPLSVSIASSSERTSSNILLHIPRDPLVPSAHGLQAAENLAHAANAQVVTVHYRAGSAGASERYSYPTPIHDVLSAWDWATSGPAQLGAVAGSPRVAYGVYGEAMGASLALMLGMTECRVGDAHRVAAVAVHDAVVDWCVLDVLSEEENAARMRERQDLLELRDRVFAARSGSARWFDPFASPIHFLRTPVVEEPDAVSASSRLQSQLEAGFLHPQAQWEDSLDALALLDDMEAASAKEAGEQGLGVARKRKYVRRWPPPSTMLAVPRFRFGVSWRDGLWGEQSTEMLTELRKGLVRDRMSGIKVDDGEDDDEAVGGGKKKKKNRAANPMVQRMRAEVEGVVEGVFEETQSAQAAGEWLGQRLDEASRDRRSL